MPQDLPLRTQLTRVAVVALLCIGSWALARYGAYRPPVLGAHAPATRFSAARADDVLARILGPEKPHPISTDENAAVRARILKEYAVLGIPAKTYRGLGCRFGRELDSLTCATVTDILAQVRPGNGKAIIMLSHYDSVPAGPGAADDEAGTAAVIESARALKAIRDPGVHPVIAINTDGEEFGLLGAAALLANRQMRSLVGAAVNVEARGNQGPSLLFQTSPGDGPLINLYADSVRAYATNSLFPTVYKLLPNDTDLTLFIDDGFPSWNFAFSERVAHYHTPLDRRRNLDLQSLQMQGDNLLGVTNSLAHTDLGALKGNDDIYISVLGLWLPRVPASWSLPLSAIAFGLVAFAISRSRTGGALPERWVPAIATFPLTVIAAALSGWILHSIAVLMSGFPDPSYAHPAYLRAALAFGVFGSAVLTTRLSETREALLGAWAWAALLAVLLSIFAVGLSPFFLFPALIAAPVLAGLELWKADWQKLPILGLIAIASLPGLIVWFSLAVAGEMLNGLMVHPLFTTPFAIALALIAPLMCGLSRKVWFSCSAGALAAALVLAVVAGLQPSFSETMPQRLNLEYFENATKPAHAVWAADTFAPLPSRLASAATFSPAAASANPFLANRTLVSPAGLPLFAYPTGKANLSKPTRSRGRHVDVALHASNLANQVVLAVPKEAGLRGVTLGGQHISWPASPDPVRPYKLIKCVSSECAQATIGLDLATRSPLTLYLAEYRYGLPPSGRHLISARPSTATPSQNGDVTVLVNTIGVPGS